MFGSRNFAPLFAAMFLGAFNDNFFKSAMVILITYRLADAAGVDERILVTAAAGIFILPFLLFSAFAGQLADKYERSALVQKIKIAEILVMLLAVLGFYRSDITLLMLVLFLMGAQSAFFGPLKYSILPQLLETKELIGANALIETGTFLAILFGTIFGGLFVLRASGLEIVNILVVLVAVSGWWASRYIPQTNPVCPSLKFRFNLLAETMLAITRLKPKKDIFLAVLSISWFYFVGTTFLSQFPTYAKINIGADEQVATLFLAAFSVGIAAGSLTCNALLRGEVSGRFVHIAALGMSFFGVLLYIATGNTQSVAGGPLMGIGDFISSPRNLAVLASLVGISFFGGLYIVPLYAIIQTRTPESELAQVVASTNIMDSLFMVLSSAAIAAALGLGAGIPQVFLATALLTLAAACGIRHSKMFL